MSRRAIYGLLQAAATFLVGGWLAACGVTGHGNAPVFMEIGEAGIEALPQVTLYQCFPIQLTAVMHFNDGSFANFTNRVTWISSNGGAATVSNGEIDNPARPGTKYAPGVLIPTGLGSTTVLANFGGTQQQQTGGIQGSIGVSVQEPNSISFRRVDQTGPVPITSLTVGAGLEQQMSVVAQLGAVESDVTGSATLAFLSGAPSNASVVGGIFVEGLGVGVGMQPTLLAAQFPNCPIVATLPVTVKAVQGVNLVPEFGTTTLISGTSERFYTFADLGNGVMEDASLQATYTSSGSTQLSFAGNTTVTGAISPLANLASAVSAGGPFQVQSFLKTFGLNPVSFPSQIINITVLGANLESLVITPSTATITQGSDDVLRFHAIGTYDNGIVQDITREATWGVSTVQTGSPTQVAQISNATNTAGFATPAQPPSLGTIDAGQLVVTAAVGHTPPNPATAQMTVLAPGQCCDPNGGGLQ